MKIIFDEVIKNDSNYDRKNLFDLINSNHKDYIASNVQVVYVYRLVDKTINYPNMDGNIVYIGEACRQKEATGKRFTQHISTSMDRGADNGSNYTVSRYYWLGYELKLTIFKLNKKQDRKKIEKRLLQAHVKKYGALPIGQGSTGKNYTVDTIEGVDYNLYEGLL